MADFDPRLLNSQNNASRQRAIAIRNANKAPIHILVISLLSILTYLGAYVIDAILLEEYYLRSEWMWFGTTLAFIVIPSIVVQVFSCKWYHDDGNLRPWTIVMHVLLLGPVERYWNVFFYGLNAPRLPEQTSYQKKYLANWRDVSMLRFLYAFIEIGPQVTLQSYILLNYKSGVDGNGILQDHTITIIKIIVTVASFALSMIAYNDELRGTQGKGLSPIGYVFQIICRVLMVAIRILSLVLFTMQFKLIVLAVIFAHWLLMIYWVKKDNPKFFTKENGKCNGCFEIVFKILMGFVYVFCYVTTIDRHAVISRAIYYLLLYLENISMVVSWIMLNEREWDTFEVSSICVFFFMLVLGVVFMFVYYKVFHPVVDVNDEGNSTRENGGKMIIL